MPLWKRCLDLAASLAAMPFLVLAILLVAIMQSLVSPGPVFFTQERVGRDDRRFRIYKFRTMRANADTRVHQAYFHGLIHSNAPMVKLDARGDSRLIPGGWLLRAVGLDELPQLLNVCRGEMSLVGPRPCLPSEYADYLPPQRQRLAATPGLTGLWQVSGKNRTTFAEMIRLDIEYARTVSLGLDLKIIALTPVALLREVQAARQARQTAGAPRDSLLPTTTHFIP